MWCRGTGTPQTSFSTTPPQVDTEGTCGAGEQVNTDVLLFTTKYNITGRPLYRNLQEHVLQGNRDNTDVLLYYTTTGRPLLKNLQEHVVQGNRDNTNVLLYYTTTGRLLLKNLEEDVVQGNRENTDVLLYYTTTSRY
jgi:hypothetical protein